MNKFKILRNIIKCKRCGAVLESRHRHDFVACSCGTAADGGLDFLGRVGNPEDYEDLSEIEKS